MEVGVRLLGVVLRLLNLLLAPLFWLRGRHRRPLPSATPPLLMRSAHEHAEAVRNGKITSEKLVLAYIERVKEVNPFLNAVVEERYRAALEDAKEVDRQLAEARESGRLEELVADKPLLGVPFTVKESCSLAGLSNSVGCLEMAGRRAGSDGAAVRRVRSAGAVPLLVSNTPELCLGWETTNLLRGTTNNPYDLNRTPGGSSGGEGALLACGASCVSVSSDIAGSIRVPAAFCGVFGHKPTPGIVPIAGHVPTLSDPQFARFLSVGPMTRHAGDLPLLLGVMAGPNKDTLALDEPVDMSKLRVFYMTEASKSIALLSVDKDIKDKIKSAAKYLEAECGATICEEKFKDFDDSVEISVSLFFSMKDIPNMLQDPNNLKREKSAWLEVIRLVLGGASRSLQGVCFALLARHRLVPAHRRGRYRHTAHRLHAQIQRSLGSSGVLLIPASSDVAHRHGQVYVRAASALYTMVFNVLGLPATVVPMGRKNGLPLAIQVVAAPNQDRLCLAVAKQLEIGFGGWQPPP